MSKVWLERIETNLPSDVGNAISDANKAIQEIVLHRHLSHWRAVSTVPYNQELELRIVENGQIVTLEFPCLKTNMDLWINVDLGTEIKIQPIEWRVWYRDKSPESHHSKIRPSDRSALFHHDLPNVSRVTNKDDR